MGFKTFRADLSDVPPPEPRWSSNRKWDRRGLLATGTGLLGALAGCSSFGDFRADGEGAPQEARTPNGETETVEAGTHEGDDTREGPLTIQTTGALTEVVHRSSGLWNANPSPTTERLVWTQLGARPEFNERLANRFAAEVGVISPGGRSDPPFHVATAVADREETGKALVNGSVDVAEVRSRRSDLDPMEYFGDRADTVVRHRVARDGWVFIVSSALADAGIDALTADQIRRVFSGEISTWRTLGGPDEEPFVFLGPDISANWNPTYENFLHAGDTVPTALDYRAGQAAQLVLAAANRDNALGVVPASGVRTAREQEVSTLDVIVDGNRLSAYEEGYPLTNDIYLYTLGEPDARERSFLELLSSPFGQRVLVGRDLLPVDLPAGDK